MTAPIRIGIRQEMQEEEKATDPNSARAKEKVEKGVPEYRHKLHEHLQLQNEEKLQRNVMTRNKRNSGR